MSGNHQLLSRPCSRVSTPGRWLPESGWCTRRHKLARPGLWIGCLAAGGLGRVVTRDEGADGACFWSGHRNLSARSTVRLRTAATPGAGERHKPHTSGVASAGRRARCLKWTTQRLVVGRSSSGKIWRSWPSSEFIAGIDDQMLSATLPATAELSKNPCVSPTLPATR
jgi:hypothetical protein